MYIIIAIGLFVLAGILLYKDFFGLDDSKKWSGKYIALIIQVLFAVACKTIAPFLILYYFLQ